MNIGEHISKVRKQKGFSQEELADLSKVNLRTIQRIEKNENTPRGKTLSLICDALEINLEKVIAKNHIDHKTKYLNLILNWFFLGLLNVVIMLIFGYLLLDSNHCINSKIGALIISLILPLFISSQTPKLSGTERLLKFGTGMVVYIILIWYSFGFKAGIVSYFFVATPIYLTVLFYGSEILKVKNKEPLLKK